MYIYIAFNMWYFWSFDIYPILELAYIHNSIAEASFSTFQKRPNFDDNEIFIKII